MANKAKSACAFVWWRHLLEMRITARPLDESGAAVRDRHAPLPLFVRLVSIAGAVWAAAATPERKSSGRNGLVVHATRMSSGATTPSGIHSSL